MDDKVKLIIEIPKKVFEARKTGEISPWVTIPILDAVQNGIPLDNDSDRAEAQAYFDGQAYGWEEGRKALVKVTKEALEKQIKRDFEYAKNETLKVPLHYGIANGYQNAIALLNNINGESEDTE